MFDKIGVSLGAGNILTVQSNQFQAVQRADFAVQNDYAYWKNH